VVVILYAYNKMSSDGKLVVMASPQFVGVAIQSFLFFLDHHADLSSRLVMTMFTRGPHHSAFRIATHSAQYFF
jgi:hypothetical protein